MLKQLWNWYNGLSMTAILGSGIAIWMTLSVVLLNSWFLVVYVAAHCVTTGLFITAILKRMPKKETAAARNLAFNKPGEAANEPMSEQRASA